MRNLSPAQRFRSRRHAEVPPSVLSVAENVLRDKYDRNQADQGWGRIVAQATHLCRSHRRHNLTQTTLIATRCLHESSADDNLQNHMTGTFLSPFLLQATKVTKATKRQRHFASTRSCSIRRLKFSVRSPESDSTLASSLAAPFRSSVSSSSIVSTAPASPVNNSARGGVSIVAPSASVTQNRALTAATAGGDLGGRSHVTNPHATPSPRAGIAVGCPSRISIRQSSVFTTPKPSPSAVLSELGSTTLSITWMLTPSTSVAAAPEFASAITNGNGDCDSSTRVSTNETFAPAGSPRQPATSRINDPAKRSLTIAQEYPIANKEER